MKNIEIQLNYNRKDFENIYFKNNQGNYFKSMTTKTLFHSALFFFILLVLSVFFSFYKNSFEIAMISSLLFFVVLLFYFSACFKLFKWKKLIHDFLDQIETYKEFRIELGSNSFIFIQGENEFMENWTNFKIIKILDDYFELEGSQIYVIPKKSMSNQDCEVMKNILKEKMK
ncbi:hypothetical protein [Aureivirga sp. CE67]|uniref:hypothetical protein n=1 Tax=Aureivirga sp. CE67 TaxID=1788983 RepID=UPI0018CAC9E4|nr:hypothetical protein [Aureivirga sp. CE67]